jgi:hypothetical protein
MGNCVRRLWAFVIVLPALCGCAVSYDDAAGNRHVLGFADVTVAPAKNVTLAGDVVAVRTIGLYAGRNAQGRTLGLGYTSEITATIKDNALVLGNPNQAVRQIFEGEQQ